MWDLIDDPELREVAVTRTQFPRPRDVVVHRSIDLAGAVPSTRQRIPVTNPLRTLIDLGAVAPIWQVRDATHRAISLRLVTVSALDAEVGRLARRGRRGIGPMRRILAERLERDRPSSVLEARMDRILLLAGVPRPRVEVTVGPDGEYRCDYIWDDIRLIIEVKGYAWHGSPEAFAADLDRELALAEHGGYQVVSLGWQQTSRPAALAHRVRRLYSARRALVLGA